MKRIFSSMFTLVLAIVLIGTCNVFPTSAEELAVPYGTPLVYKEAENCELTGCSVGTYGSGYVGSGYAEYINQIGDGIKFTAGAFTGYATLVIQYSQGERTNQSLSLFVDSKFIRKINFKPTGAWDYTWGNIEVPFYLPSLNSTVELKYTSGDGNVDIDYVVCYPRPSETKMVIVPHEDDEIFAFCGSIQRMKENGNDVRVVLMTNGDWYGKAWGRKRIRESVNALAHVGISKEDIIVLGYGDGILSDLYGNTSNPNTVITAPGGSNNTYGDVDNSSDNYNIYDYHTIQTGSSAKYTRNNLMSDLKNVISSNAPSEIFTTSSYDTHADHSATYHLVDEAITSTGSKPLLHESIVHGIVANWPVPYDKYDPAPTPVPFTSPFPANNEPLKWADATKINLTPSMLSNKYAAIKEYHSQNDDFGWASYDFSFYKSDEFYWTKDYSK